MNSDSWKFIRAVSVVLVILFAACTMTLAQLTTADIVGTVRDSSGALVTTAKVTLEHLETHQSSNISTNSVGNFLFTFLAPGHYSIRVEAPGFKSVTIPNLAVEAGDRARADATLPVGEATQTIEVVAQSPLLQTDNATVSSTITDISVQDLPLNGRNFVQLVQLVPGANEGPGNGLTSGGRPDDRRPTNGFSVNAFDDTLNNQIIDGIDNNERIIGTIGVKPSIDAIQEVTVETNNYAPEIGRTAGGVVNVITKQGANSFHGSVYEFFRNDIFDTRSAFATAGVVPKPKLEQNQFGGSIGGPIVKDKTFFFFDYEGSRLISGTTYTSTVPTIGEFNNIHSLNGGSPQAQLAKGNGTTGLPVDPIALNYLMLYPAPNLPGASNNFVTDPNKTQNSTTLDGRVDHKFNNNNNMYVRYTHNNVVTNNPAQLPNVVNGLIAGGGRWNFSGAATDKADQFAINYTHVFNPNTLMQLRAAYTRINNLSLPLNAGTNGDSKVGWAGSSLNSQASGLTPIGINGFPDLGDGAYVPLQDIDGSYQYDGFVSYHHGNHDMKFGAGLIRRQARNVQSAFPFGQYSFGLSSDGSNNDNVLASTLAGAYTAQSYNVDINTPDYRSWEPSVFAQDTWKATRWLTFVYGVRYDLYTPFTEAHNHISNFDFNTAVAGGTPAAAAAALKIAGANGVSNTAGIKTDYSNFAPRLGFSAQIAPGTVLRGGIGLSFFPGNYTSNADLKNAPFVSVFSPTCVSAVANTILVRATGSPSPNGVCSNDFDAGMPLPTGQTINSGNLSFVAQDPKFKSGVATQYNLLIEKAFGPNVLTIGYVGVHGSHLPETINDINEPSPNNFNAANLPRPLAGVLPNLGSVGWLASEGVSNYNGLQTSFQRRLSSGLTASLNYTWSHALSDVTGMSEEGQEGWSNGDPFNIRRYEYSNADNDIRHRFAGTATYVLPFGKNLTGAKKMLLGGWQTNAILAWQSGHPFTVVNNGNDGGFGNRAHGGIGGNGGVDRPNMYAAGAGVPADAGSTCITGFGHDFCPQAFGTVGNEPRNALFGPHFRHLDMSLFKDFQVRESLKLQFRTEVFNVSNTPNYFINNNVNSSPATLLGNGSFGQTTGVDPNYVPRQFQFVLKILF
jgi:Carboxypeptidase regulatory-like domain